MRKLPLALALLLLLVSMLPSPIATGTVKPTEPAPPAGPGSLAAAPVTPRPALPPPPAPPPEPVQPWETWEQVQAGWQQASAAVRPGRVAVKGIFMTGYTAGQDADRLIDLIKRTELNAVVVDLKNDAGQVTYDSRVPLAKAIDAVDTVNYMQSLDKFVAKLKAAEVYAIARIVTFKDPILSQQHPEWATLRQGGGVWRDYNGAGWLNPYSKQAWDYNLSIAKEAALRGFDEIQFDYVRFPSDGEMSTMVFPGSDQRSKARVVADFLSYARKELAPYHVWVSADVFGLVISVPDDMGIGQQYEELGPAVDYISPMVYPSHYGPGNLGLDDPDGSPYQTVYRAMQDATRRAAAGGWTNLTIRPWLQDFSLHHEYPPEWVRQQIQAVHDAGLQEWLLWNAGNVYSETALKHK